MIVQDVTILKEIVKEKEDAKEDLRKKVENLLRKAIAILNDFGGWMGCQKFIRTPYVNAQLGEYDLSIWLELLETTFLLEDKRKTLENKGRIPEEKENKVFRPRCNINSGEVSISIFSSENIYREKRGIYPIEKDSLILRYNPEYCFFKSKRVERKLKSADIKKYSELLDFIREELEKR